jgi:hypothetical protein
MISRYLGARMGLALVVLTASALCSTPALADGPSYTYVGASYEWTDSKYGVDPNGDPRYNNGTFEGANIDLSLGLLSWLHLTGQYFSGDCAGCGTGVSNSQPVTFDTDFSGYEVGLGVNLSLDRIGLNENTDFVLRANVLSAELDGAQNSGLVKLDDNGWSLEGQIRGQISDRAEIMVGYSYQDLDSVKNRDAIVALAYRVWAGLALTAEANVFDDDTGFSLGLRWYFGDLLFGDRDTIVR